MIVCCNPLALASLPSWGDLEGWFLHRFALALFSVFNPLLYQTLIIKGIDGKLPVYRTLLKITLILSLLLYKKPLSLSIAIIPSLYVK